MKIPAAILPILRPLARKAAGLKIPLYVVGGCVRDWTLGRSSSDIDLAAEADPQPLARLCAQMLDAKPQAFGRFGTLRVIGKKYRVDFATSRRESYPEPASLPQVGPAPIGEDLWRRDFTINAMALPLHPDKLGSVIDPYGGMRDLREGILRVLHPKSFSDDPTRVFRAARFLRRFGLKPAAGVLAQARAALKEGHAGLLSRHRLAQELLCVLEEKDPGPVLKLLRGWGYLALIDPRIKWPARAPLGVQERLGAMALAMGRGDGERLLRALPLERSKMSSLFEILEVASGKASPKRELSPVVLRVLRQAFPALAPGALRPLWITGEDIAAAGVVPGKAYRDILDAAGRLQWSGKINSRGQAKAWLKSRLSPRSILGAARAMPKIKHGAALRRKSII